MITIVQQRLHNQLLVGTPLEPPTAVVAWLGAMQAQDFAGALWAVAQRTYATTEAALTPASARKPAATHATRRHRRHAHHQREWSATASTDVPRAERPTGARCRRASRAAQTHRSSGA